MKLLLVSLLAYLLGSIPFGILIGKAKGVNLRELGSGNIGAANAIRNLGVTSGSLVLLGDMAKSILALVIAKGILNSHSSPLEFVLVGIGAILGHNYSCFLRFQGGKGVASTLGVFFFISWKVTLIALFLWIIVAAVTRFASLASLVSSFCLPFFLWFFHEPAAYVFFALFAFVLILYKHKGNIDRLLHGKENKIAFKI